MDENIANHIYNKDLLAGNVKNAKLTIKNKY